MSEPGIEVYDREGKPISLAEWSRLHRQMEYKRVAQDTIGAYWVSTVWLGMNHNWSNEGPPIIFETMVFPADGGPAHDIWMDRYATEAEALAGHESICTLIRATVATELTELTEDSKQERQ